MLVPSISRQLAILNEPTSTMPLFMAPPELSSFSLPAVMVMEKVSSVPLLGRNSHTETTSDSSASHSHLPRRRSTMEPATITPRRVQGISCSKASARSMVGIFRCFSMGSQEGHTLQADSRNGLLHGSSPGVLIPQGGGMSQSPLRSPHLGSSPAGKMTRAMGRLSVTSSRDGQLGSRGSW